MKIDDIYRHLFVIVADHNGNRLLITAFRERTLLLFLPL